MIIGFVVMVIGGFLVVIVYEGKQGRCKVSIVFLLKVIQSRISINYFIGGGWMFVIIKDIVCKVGVVLLIVFCVLLNKFKYYIFEMVEMVRKVVREFGYKKN